MRFIVYRMEYQGSTVKSDIELAIFDEKYFDEYEAVYDECFYEMRKALNVKPYHCCAPLERLIEQKSDIFLLLAEELIGSVRISGNEIDDLIVSKRYQRQKYGKNSSISRYSTCSTKA